MSDYILILSDAIIYSPCLLSYVYYIYSNTYTFFIVLCSLFLSFFIQSAVGVLVELVQAPEDVINAAK